MERIDEIRTTAMLAALQLQRDLAANHVVTLSGEIALLKDELLAAQMQLKDLKLPPLEQH